MNIGERFKHIRETVGINQGEFAQALEVSQGYVSNIESGKKSPSESLIKLVVLNYRVSKSWLADGTGEMFPPNGSSPGSAAAEGGYALHGGDAPDFEAAPGVKRGSPGWKAFEMLGRIYASADPALIASATAALQALSEAAECSKRADEAEGRAALLQERVREMAIEARERQKIITALGGDRRGETDRRQNEGTNWPVGEEHRAGTDRRQGRN
jgi:transcriptional regulator with XRE-family HTH domain